MAPMSAGAEEASGCTASMKDRIKRLNMQLPRTSPTAILGSGASAVAPKPVNSSGRLVVAATMYQPNPAAPQTRFFTEDIAVSGETQPGEDDDKSSAEKLQPDHSKGLDLDCYDH